MSILRVGTLSSSPVLGEIVRLIGNLSNFKIVSDNDYLLFEENKCLIEFSVMNNLINIYPRYLSNVEDFDNYISIIEEYIVCELQKYNVLFVNQLDVKFFVYSPILINDKQFLYRYSMFHEKPKSSITIMKQDLGIETFVFITYLKFTNDFKPVFTNFKNVDVTKICKNISVQTDTIPQSVYSNQTLVHTSQPSQPYQPPPTVPILPASAPVNIPQPIQPPPLPQLPQPPQPTSPDSASVNQQSTKPVFGQNPATASFGQNPATASFGQNPATASFGQNQTFSNFGSSQFPSTFSNLKK